MLSSFTVQLSHPYMTTGKTLSLTRQTFVGKVMSLLFNMLSRLVVTFLPRRKRLLISWLQSPSAVILEPKKIRSVTVSIVSPSICHGVMGPEAVILVFWSLFLAVVSIYFVFFLVFIQCLFLSQDSIKHTTLQLAILFHIFSWLWQFSRISGFFDDLGNTE